MTVSSPADRSGGVSAFAWAAWPVAAWLLPALLVLRGIVGEGWEAVLILVAAPVLVPVTALLALLPRFMLRRRGSRQLSLPLVGVLFTQWVCGAVLIAVLPGTGDSGALPSLLRSVVPIAAGAEEAFFWGALLAVLATWVASLVLALRSGRVHI